MKRTSVVHGVKVKILDSASVFEAGDSEYINNVSYAIALQRQNSRFGSLDTPFEKFYAFTSTIPIPDNPSPVRKITYNAHPFITVGNVRAIGFANSSVFQIGSTGNVRMESRALQIRNFIKMPPGTKVRGPL